MLRDAKIRSAKRARKPYKLTDAGGLYIEVKPTGSKLWRYRYRIAGKENVYALGEYTTAPTTETKEQARKRREGGVFTLTEARAERDRCRALVKQGVHPAHERKLDRIRRKHESANTFRAVAAEWLVAKDWTQRVKDSIGSLLDDDVFPHIGDLPIRQVAPAHVLDILNRIKSRSPTGAAQVKRAISGIFELAISTLRAESDPSYPVRKSLKQPKSENKAALSVEQIGKVMQAIDGYRGNFTTQSAFRLMWWTVARPNEVLGARWAEFDLDAAMWRIPAERMKMGSEHVIPLPTQAVDLLRRLHGITGKRNLLFPHRDDRTKPIVDATLRQAVKHMALPFRYSPHATRATGSTRLNELGYRADVIERQLAHQERNSSRRAYNQALYVGERQEMMQRWSDLLDAWAKGDKVIAGKFSRAA
jgi:integrase